MLVLNCGKFQDALNFNLVQTAFQKESPMNLVGHVTVTPKRWSLMGGRYAQSELENEAITPNNVFCNSDHFLNGIRVKIKESQLSDEEVAKRFMIRFFPGDGREMMTLTINSQGRLNRWPEGFFDQFEDDLSKL